jgi:tetratricopeptide (TPR) repeat protein
LRDLWRDGELSADDRARLDEFTRIHRLREGEVAALARRFSERATVSLLSLRRGKALAERRHLAEAEQELRRAVEADSESPDAWANLGAVLALAGRPEEAVDCYRNALRLDPQNWLALYNWALVLARQGEVGEALDKLDSALSALPSGEHRRALVDAMLSEEDLANVRADPRFPDLLAVSPRPMATSRQSRG